MKNNINKKVKSILDLVFEINSIEGYDAFFNYSGHVDSIEVRVQENHDYHKEEVEFKTHTDDRVYLNEGFYVSFNDDRLEQLDSLQTKLSNFLNRINKENS